MNRALARDAFRAPVRALTRAAATVVSLYLLLAENDDVLTTEAGDALILES